MLGSVFGSWGLGPSFGLASGCFALGGFRFGTYLWDLYSLSFGIRTFLVLVGFGFGFRGEQVPFMSKK